MLRDDFSKATKQILAARVGGRCSRPVCRALTSGPRVEPCQSVSVGVAAHICAASPGGPRYDAAMTVEERTSADNGIWLCQNCAKMADGDPSRYTREVLIDWRAQAEESALHEIGRSAPPLVQGEREAEEELRRAHRLRDEVHEAFLLPLDKRRAIRQPCKTYEKFGVSEVIIRRLDYSTYPEIDPAPGISSWFKLETYDFYHNGIVFVLRAESGIVDDMGHWSFIPHGAEIDASIYAKCNIWRLGRIPWRNIRHYDLWGDEYYRCPHLYCTYSDNGMPYEDFTAAVIGDDYDRPLDSEDEFKYPDAPKLPVDE